MRSFDRQAQHDTRSDIDEVNLEHLAHKGEGPGSTQVTLDDLDLVLAGEILDVKGSRDIEFSRDLV